RPSRARREASVMQPCSGAGSQGVLEGHGRMISRARPPVYRRPMRIGHALVAVVLVVGPAGAQLREPEGAPPPALVARAVPLSSRWIQLVLPEHAYTSV